MIHDWNGNGRKDDFIDNSMDYKTFKAAADGNRRSPQNNSGCCLACFILMIGVPTGLTILVFHVISTLA